MSKLQALLVLVVAGCTSSSGPGPTGDDGTSLVDAPITATPIAVNCQPHMRSEVAPDGSKTVTTTKSALVDVTPADRVMVTFCYPIGHSFGQDSCPSGYTCTGASYPGSAQDQRCVSYFGGTFIGGKLLVSCGGSFQVFNAAGSITSSSSVDFQNVTVVKF